MEQQNKKIAKLKRTVGELNNKIEFLEAKNEKQRKEHCVKLCDQEEEFRVIVKILKGKGQERIQIARHICKLVPQMSHLMGKKAYLGMKNHT